MQVTIRALLLYATWHDYGVDSGDLVCAFMQADASKTKFAIPPHGCQQEGWCWQLLGAMNGMREAAADFTNYFADVMCKKMNFGRGKLEQCMYNRGVVRVVAHIDDPLVAGDEQGRSEYWTELATHVVLKKGAQISAQKACIYLGLEYRALLREDIRGFAVRLPEKYIKSMAELCEFTAETKSLSTPMARDTDKPKGEELRLTTTNCDAKQHRQYRAIVGKLQWAKHCRADISYSVKCLSHKLSAPTLWDLTQAKRCVRYLLGTIDVWQAMQLPNRTPQELSSTVKQLIGYSDFDWAGDKTTRRSTTCSVIS